MSENLFVGGEIGALMQSHDWSQTPFGAIETWSGSLKTTMQILLTELDRANQQEKTQVEQAEAALRESEAKYRTLCESLDEGFCLCEMLFDENGEPTRLLAKE